MENASKALIIAGAILISILIIAIGMYIYTSSRSSIDEGVGQMSTQEKEAFNSKWTQYDGEFSGNQVKSMINSIISNAKTYEEEPSKQLVLGGIYTKKASADGTVSCTAPLDDQYLTNLNAAYKSIESKHTYGVSVEYNQKTALIHGISVYYDLDSEDAEKARENIDKKVEAAVKTNKSEESSGGGVPAGGGGGEETPPVEE